MNKLHQGIALLSIAAMSLGLVGCGGGGASGGGTTPTITALSGTAAVGFAVVNGTVNIKCANSTAIAPSTTSAAGAIQVNLVGQTLPCALQVSGGTINGVANTNNYHSIASSAGNVNVTPLTDLLVANLAGTATPTTWFAGLTTAQLAAITAGQITTAATNVKTALGLTTQLAGIDLITTAFTPTRNNVMDNTLEALQAAITNNVTPYAILLTGAGANAHAGFTTPAGFNAALTAAYVPPRGATTPTVTGFSPNTGAVGTTVTITGTSLGLGFQPAPIVKFGTTAVTTPLTFNGQTSISFAVPTSLAAGAQTITIGGMAGVPLTVGTFTVTAAPVVPPAPSLAAPTGVTATAASSNTINVSWTPVTGATAYYIYRATTAGLPVASMSPSGTALTSTFTDTTVVAGTTYYYKVVPQNIIFLTGTLVATGPASAEVSATPTALPVAVPIAGLMGGAKQGTPLALAATVSTFAGTGTAGSLNGVGVAASFGQPRGITTEGTNLYVIDTIASKIRQINIATGTVTTLNAPAYNTANPAGLMAPQDITTDGTYLYVANAFYISRIVIATGASSILAGSATVLGSADGIGAAASFNLPYGITTDGTNVYVTEVGNNKVRQIVIATGAVTTLAGSGVAGSVDGIGTAATFTNLRGITTDGTNLYVVEVGTSANVRKIVIATGAVTTVAGSPTLFGSVNGTGTAATFTIPTGITTDGTNLYIADAGAQNIRKVVIATGVVTTLAGTGLPGAIDGAGAGATFYAPSGIISDGVSLYVSDLTNNKIRKIQ